MALRPITLISLGSNEKSGLRDAASIVLKSSHELSDRLKCHIDVSKLYHTPAFPTGSGPDFVNAACSQICDQPQGEILTALHEIEQDAGRVRTIRWGSRTLDLDLLAVGDLVRPDRKIWQYWHDLTLDAQMRETPDQLILPHPRLHQRSFVLVPLADVAPDWVHPVLGQSVTAMRDALPEADIASVVSLGQ